MKNLILVATFMGMQKTDLGWFDNDEHLNDGVSNTFDTLHFGTDWNWFMTFYSKLVKDCSLVELSVYEDLESEIHSIEDAFTANDIETAFGNAIDILKAFNSKDNG